MARARNNQQQRTSQALQAKQGLAPMLQQQGADPEITEAAQLVESMPGGPELLYTVAAEEMMKKAGVSKKDAKKVRLYEMGGYVEKAEGGALKAAAAKTKAGGRGSDSMMLHVSPEEFEAITAMWGAPDVNPDTGIPEYGFLSKLWKKVKKAVKKIVKSDIFQIVAPIALSIFAPGLGTAIGSALGASGTAASVVGNALVRGSLSAAGGRDFMSGAISGAVSGGLGSMVGDKIGGLTGDALSESTRNVIGAGLASGAGAELTGGDFMEGAIQGGLSEAFIRPTMEGITAKGQEMFGLEDPGAGGILATKVTPGTEAIKAISSGEAMYDPATGAYITDPSAAQIDLAAAATPGAAPPPVGGAEAAAATPAGATTPAAKPGGLSDLAVPALLAMGAAGASPYEEAVPPEIPPHLREPLPIYQSTRQFIGPTDPNAYYTYGQQGAPQTAENLFITPDPFSGETGTPTSPTGGLGVGGNVAQLIASMQPVPQNIVGGAQQQLMQAGYTLDPNTQTWMPPQQLGQGFGRAMGGYQEGGERFVRGPGTGRSDDIPARLSDGEYVIDAESVALLGDGSGDAGAKRLDEMRRNLRQHKATNLKKGGFSHKAKQPHQYMRGGGMARLRAATAGRA